MDYTFAYPDFFWGLLLIPLLLAWQIVSLKRQVAHLLSSSIDAFSKSGSLAKWRPILLVLRLLAIALIVTALARPQTQDVSTQTKTNKGIDIVIAMIFTIRYNTHHTVSLVFVVEIGFRQAHCYGNGRPLG